MKKLLMVTGGGLMALLGLAWWVSWLERDEYEYTL